MTWDEDIPPEEKEKWNLDRERDADALEDYVKVDRVIGKRKDDEGDIEYLVKCTLLLVSHVIPTNTLKGRDFTTTRAPGRTPAWSATLHSIRSTGISTVPFRYRNRTKPNRTRVREDDSNICKNSRLISSTGHFVNSK